MNTRSFFKSLALMAAGAVAAPTIFIPRCEPIKWKAARGVLTQEWLLKIADELDADACKYYGKWHFIETTYRLNGDVFVPDDALHFKPYPVSNQPHPGWISVIES